jgi:hypothetical protein
MIGVETPTYVAVLSLSVNRDDLAAAYKEILTIIDVFVRLFPYFNV